MNRVLVIMDKSIQANDSVDEDRLLDHLCTKLGRWCSLYWLISSSSSVKVAVIDFTVEASRKTRIIPFDICRGLSGEMHVPAQRPL